MKEKSSPRVKRTSYAYTMCIDGRSKKARAVIEAIIAAISTPPFNGFTKDVSDYDGNQCAAAFIPMPSQEEIDAGKIDFPSPFAFAEKGARIRIDSDGSNYDTAIVLALAVAVRAGVIVVKHEPIGEKVTMFNSVASSEPDWAFEQALAYLSRYPASEERSFPCIGDMMAAWEVAMKRLKKTTQRSRALARAATVIEEHFRAISARAGSSGRLA